ncbi:response regulator [Amycolatopsis suaedae]|uniref:Response regulator transcription factor n=1 Tax=Amycolatopsis suaedae TaxID=2510978 RepID=A0A4V2EM58_9PSEU|nr:response regulator transcription factor [Amycolatopsis suaedae]RZQ63915.1 response regulator transcription factor [Amycolatopsis suaedae]
MIRVVVVDDEALVRFGLELIFRGTADIDVVATTTGALAVREVGLRGPDVVLLDIRTPGVDALTVVRQLRAMPRPPAVAMLTTAGSGENVAAALRCGAAGFFLKDTEPQHLAQYIRTLASGGVVLSRDVTRSAADDYLDTAARSAASAGVARLTKREREVLVLLAEGLSNLAIGVRMHLSRGTIKDHVSTVLAKLGVGNRVQAALIAQRAGLLRRPGA